MASEERLLSHAAHGTGPQPAKFDWFCRPRRVLLTLGVIWVIAVFDLLFTLLEWGNAHFVELNPLAAHVLNQPLAVICAFKFGLLGFGSLIMLAFARYRVAELGCWLLFCMMMYVLYRWLVYFDCLLHNTTSPVIQPLW